MKESVISNTDENMLDAIPTVIALFQKIGATEVRLDY